MVGEPFRLGRVVARSFAIWGRELPVLLVLAAMIHAPRVAFIEGLDRVWPIPPMPDIREHGALRSWYVLAIPHSLAGVVLAGFFRDLSVGVVIFAAYARLQGRRRGVRECARGGLRRFLPVLRVSLVLTLLATCLSYALLLAWLEVLSWRLYGWWLPFFAAAPFIILLGIPMLLSPFWVAVSAAVLEQPRRLLRRSRALTRGHRLAVCAMIVLLLALDWGSTGLLRLGLRGVDLPWLARKGIWWTQDLLVVSLSAVFVAVGYHALRLEKEGVDVSNLEEIFA